MQSIEKIHKDLCWVIYYAQKDILNINLQKPTDPKAFLDSITPYRYLFDPQLIQQLSAAIATEKNETQRQLMQNIKFLLVEYGGIFENYQVMFAFQVARSNRKLLVPSYDTRKITVPEAYNLTFNSDITRYIRLELFDAYSDFYLRQSKHLNVILQAHHARAESLGFNSIFDMIQDATPYDLNELERNIESYLERTNVGFQRELDKHMRERVGMKLYEGNPVDLRVLNDPKFYPTMTNHKKSTLLKQLNTALGFNCDLNKINVHQINSRENAFFIQLINPNSLDHFSHLFYNNKNNFLEWKSYLHEIGYFFHFSNISNEIPLLDQMTGDIAISEISALIFEKLLYEKKFMLDFFNLEIDLSIPRFQDLLMKRSIYVRALFQLRIFKQKNQLNQNLGDKRRLFERIFLAQLDLQLETNISHSRILLIISNLYQKIKNNFSNEWWKNPDFGKFLSKNYFSNGFSIPLEKIVF